MRLLTKLAGGRRPAKAWSEPDFWSVPSGVFDGGLAHDREGPAVDFDAYVAEAYKKSSLVFALIQNRMSVFSGVSFRWRDQNDGVWGEPYGTSELGLLEQPWPGGTTSELLSRMEQDASLAGNFYATVADDAGRLGRAATGPGRRIARILPNRVWVILGAASTDPRDVDARPVAYLVKPGGGRPEVILLPGEVCHYSPIPDPEARWRGMSWLTPLLEDIGADKAATKHKAKFFKNGASPQFALMSPENTTRDEFDKFRARYHAEHTGGHNAYRTLLLRGGWDVKPLAADLRQLDFKVTQGAGESRAASVAGVPPVIAGFSEGLQGSSLNAGNYGMARRRFADGTLHNLWTTASASLQALLTPPRPNAALWHDTREVPFVREDRRDVIEIQSMQATILRNLLDSGYDPDAAIRMLASEDWNTLTGQHSGLFSVQLQPPGTSGQAVTPPGGASDA